MNLQNRLDRLIQDLPGAQIAAFGDLSSSLVLRSSTRTRCPREELDRLCAQAKQALSVCDCLPPTLCDDDVYGRTAIAFTADASQIFASDPATPDEFTALVVDGWQDLRAAFDAVQLTAQQIGQSA